MSQNLMNDEGRNIMGPATKYAQEYVKKVKRPLTEADLVHTGTVPLCIWKLFSVPIRTKKEH